MGNFKSRPAKKMQPRGVGVNVTALNFGGGVLAARERRRRRREDSYFDARRINDAVRHADVRLAIRQSL